MSVPSPECPTDPEVMIQGRSTLLICSPNYLGLAAHPAVITSFQDATLRFGAGTVGSGVISGYTTAHQKVEEDLARFMNVDTKFFSEAPAEITSQKVSEDGHNSVRFLAAHKNSEARSGRTPSRNTTPSDLTRL